MKAKDLTGQNFGRWLVLERDFSKNNGRSNWKCQCSCINKTIKIVDGYSLTSGRSQSCGCIKQEQDLEKHKKAEQNKQIKKEEKEFLKTQLENNRIGQIFNNLKIISYAYTKDKHKYYNCKCLKCGTNIIVRWSLLVNNHTTSCGCIKSKGEEKISLILAENKIPFEIQKTFDSCRFLDTNYLAKFDFYVNNKYLIEYDGEQHFSYYGGWNSQENFEKVVKHDIIKNQWCKDNNIPLIRIPYTILETLNINDLKLETSNFII